MEDESNDKRLPLNPHAKLVGTLNLNFLYANGDNRSGGGNSGFDGFGIQDEVPNTARNPQLTQLETPQLAQLDT